MNILIEDKYEGVGCIDITLAHDNTAMDCKQGLNTKLRIQADTSTYITALSGVNEYGGVFTDLEIQGIEAIGFIKALHLLTGKLLQVAENTN